MEIKTEIVCADNYNSIRAMLHSSHEPDQRGRFAMALIERWGLVAGTPDGEDSAGRAKLALLPVSEMVERAISTAEETYRVLAERGMLIEMPSYEQLVEMERKQRGRN